MAACAFLHSILSELSHLISSFEVPNQPDLSSAGDHAPVTCMIYCSRSLAFEACLDVTALRHNAVRVMPVHFSTWDIRQSVCLPAIWLAVTA